MTRVLSKILSVKEAKSATLDMEIAEAQKVLDKLLAKRDKKLSKLHKEPSPTKIFEKFLGL